MTVPPRHALLRVDAEGWAALLAERPDLADDPLLQTWAPQRPLISRRGTPDDRPGMTPAGIPLPPSHGKRRIAVILKPDAIRSVAPPPKLADVQTIAPDVWHPTITAALALGVAVGSEPRVYGSFAWEALTGLAYVGPLSDLDLLWAVTPETDVDHLLTGLAGIDAEAPGRLDGEVIVGTAQRAANWRELHRGGDVLVKTSTSVSLHSAAWFLDERAS